MAKLETETGDNTVLGTDDAARSEGPKLLAETIAAHGGEAFLNVKTLKITGTGEFTTPPQIGGLTVSLSSFTFYVATGGRCRLEAQSPGGPVLFVIRGNDRGGFVTLVRRTLQLPAAQTTGIEPTEFLRTAAKQGDSLIAVAKATDEIANDGKPLLRYDVYSYNVYKTRDTATQVFIEADTKLVRKMVLETPRGEITVLLSSYKLTSGLAMFREIQLLENGASVLKLFAKEITVDDYVKDTLFEQP